MIQGIKKKRKLFPLENCILNYRYLKRRKKEHTRNYKKSPVHTMPPDGEFEYDFTLPLSKYNTLRYEDKNRERWQEEQIGEFVRNDRFCCEEKPKQVEIIVRKTYEIIL